MRSYYYFVASLPSLSFDGEMPLTPDELLERSQAWLAPEDYALLAAAQGGFEALAAHPAGAAWLACETSLRNALVRARALRLERDPAPYLREPDTPDRHVLAVVQELVKLDDPLAAERGLDLLRWQALDHLAGLHSFDMHVLLAYMLKLTIMARWAAFDETRGAAVLNRALEAKHAATAQMN